jgi:hypothetical protein
MINYNNELLKSKLLLKKNILKSHFENYFNYIKINNSYLSKVELKYITESSIGIYTNSFIEKHENIISINK